MKAELLASLTPAQREAVEFPFARGHGSKKHLVIEAGAGAGKTHVLSLRAAKLCDPSQLRPMHPSRLFLVTFSRAADRELRDRVLRSLDGVGLGKYSRLVHVSTIDSLLMSLVETRYGLFWEEAAQNLWTRPEWVRRYSPPTLTLMDEGIVKEKLERKLVDLLEVSCARKERAYILCDFLLSGAFAGGFRFGDASRSQTQVLDTLLSALLSEHFLALDAEAPLLAAEKFHPEIPQLLLELQQLARDSFAQRLMQGTVTYTDLTVFLYNFYCVKKGKAAGTFFDVSLPRDWPVVPEELIVDEYQDTSRIQHALLWALATQKSGRMVVVGDPKQSIYGFRNAHVEILNSLKANPLWHTVELKVNFRSEPRLLEEINALSQAAFEWQERPLPEEFQRSAYAQAALARQVQHNPLQPGRKSETPNFLETRVDILSASLSSERNNPEKIPSGALKLLLTQGLIDHLKNLKEKTGCAWSEIALLCERNKLVLDAAKALNDAGIPATPLVSSAKGGRPLEAVAWLRAHLFLYQSLLSPLPLQHWLEILSSPLSGVPFDELAQMLSALGEGFSDFWETSTSEELHLIRSEKTGKVISLEIPLLKEFHALWLRAKRATPLFAFQAWQVMRHHLLDKLFPDSTEPSQEHIASDEFALQLHEWMMGRACLDEFVDFPHHPDHWSIENPSEENTFSSSESLQVLTIHGAKGLEWPHVLFWPQQRARSRENAFELVSHGKQPVIKWLAEDLTTLGVLPWKTSDATHPCQGVLPSRRDEKQETLHYSDVQKELEEFFERQRVFYTAFTRARETLCLVHPLPMARTRNSLRDKLAKLNVSEKGQYEKCGIANLEEGVFARYLDERFITGQKLLNSKGEVLSRGGKGISRHLEEPWAGPCADVVSQSHPHVRFREYCLPHLPHISLEALEEDSYADFGVETSAKLVASPTSQRNISQASFETLSLWQGDQVKSLSGAHSDRKNRASTLKQRTKTNPYYERRLKASQGVLYHSAQEIQLQQQSPARALKKASLRTWQELEVWHEAPGKQKTTSLLLEAPSRNILDFLCVLPLSQWPFASVQTQISTFCEPTSQGLRSDTDSIVPVVLDFKTGAPSEEHQQQMELYGRLASEILKEGLLFPSHETSLPYAPFLFAVLCYHIDWESHEDKTFEERQRATQEGLKRLEETFQNQPSVQFQSYGDRYLLASFVFPSVFSKGDSRIY
jgi:ATP-dependent exoDNAse (exonuclease V) beta subunit